MRIRYRDLLPPLDLPVRPRWLHLVWRHTSFPNATFAASIATRFNNYWFIWLFLPRKYLSTVSGTLECPWHSKVPYTIKICFRAVSPFAVVSRKFQILTSSIFRFLHLFLSVLLQAFNPNGADDIIGTLLYHPHNLSYSLM